jgi:hypothetical protein
MAISGAQLLIEVEIGTRCRIRIEDSTERHVEVTSELSEIRLQGIKDEFRAELEAFRTALASQSQWRLGNPADALLSLQKRGRLTLNELFGGQGAKIDEAMQLCRDACPNWETPGWENNSWKPPVVIVRAKLGAGIPIELLPWLRWKFVEKVDSEKALGRLAASFLGFSAIVKRDIGVPPPNMLLLENRFGENGGPRLPLKMFSYRMSGSRQEEKFFSGRTDIDFGQAWPDDGAPANDNEFARALAKYLWYPERGFSGTPRQPPDQVFHFSCHCDTSNSRSGQHTLTLNTGGW